MTRTFDPHDDPAAAGELAAKRENLGLPTGDEADPRPISPTKFNTLGAARSYVARAVKIMMIVLGDDDLFWVVTPAEGERLVRGGYEYAE